MHARTVCGSLLVALAAVSFSRAQTTVAPPATAGGGASTTIGAAPPPATNPAPGSFTANTNTTNTISTATPPPANSGTAGNFSGQWRSPTGEVGASGNLPSRDGMTAIGGAPRVPIAKVTSGNGTLPNQNGQVWREYDISPYTARVTSTNRPEQAIVDWILRETGYEAWHSGVVSILSSDARTLRVYHTPEIQAIVGDVVDRFLRSEGDSQAVNVRIVSVDGPNWRTRGQQVLRPVPVQTQGIQAWLIAREDAALLTADMRKRMDFREHGAPQLFIAGGQSAVVSLMKPRPYTADVTMRNDVWPGYETKAAQYDEGMSVEISPLGSLDGKSLDAVVKVNIDQLERLHTLAVDVPSQVAPRQRTNIAVPQVSQFRLHDRFRFPVDQVLLVSLGVVPLPQMVDATTSPFKLPEALSGGPDRGEMLIFIEAKPQGVGTAPAVAPTQPTQPTTPPAILGNLPTLPMSPSRPRY